MFTYTYQPRYGDFKNFSSIKPSAVLDMVQDVSVRASRECGYDLDKMKSLELAWLVQGINGCFVKEINPYDEIEIFTGINKMRGAVSERGCIISQNGDVVGKTVSNWFIFDNKKNRPSKIPEEMLSAYELYDFNDSFFNFKKMEFFTALLPEYYIRVSNKEIDTNMHLNNQKGAELLMDGLPFEFNFNEFSIFYKNPAFLNDELGVCIKATQNGYYVHLVKKDNTICVAGIFEHTKNSCEKK